MFSTVPPSKTCISGLNTLVLEPKKNFRKLLVYPYSNCNHKERN